MKNFRKIVPQRKLYSEYVKIMNGIFGLSKREAEVYSFVIRLDSEWRPASEKDFKDILSTSNRRLVIRECNINKTNLSRLIIDLKRKGLLTQNTQGGYEVPSSISIDLNSKVTEIVFTLEVGPDDRAGKDN